MTIRSDIPTCPERPAARSTGTSRDYEISLITPLFGGGVKTRENDPSFAIRPTAIRGQLQFWWRATVGAQYATSESLRVAESEVWGNTDRASGVQVRIETVKTSEPVACARFEHDRNDANAFRSMPTWNAPFNDTALPYALFPFQGQLANGRRRIDVEPASCIHKAVFRLEINAHQDLDFAKQVEPAIWAWLNFGGVGCRTRRGCGTIYCKELAPKDRDDLKAAWLRHMPELFPQREWPTLAEAVLVAPVQPDAITAWDCVIGKFKHFRQGVGFARNPGQQPNRPGRSRYPEPESIRDISNLGTSRQRSGHQRLPAIPADAFPRAELGLPIVFHYPPGQGEPTDTVLYPANDSDGNQRERMASPLVLKPLALQSGKAIPLILRLKTPVLSGVDLRRGENSVSLPSTTAIRDPRLSSYPNSPLTGSPDGSALEAFIEFARDKQFTDEQFTEVKR